MSASCWLAIPKGKKQLPWMRRQAGERTIDELPLEVLGHLQKDFGATGVGMAPVHMLITASPPVLRHRVQACYAALAARSVLFD